MNMHILDTRLRNLLTILNKNIDGEFRSNTVWTELVDKEFPYSEVKPTTNYYTYKCDPASVKNINLNYLNILSILGFVEKRSSKRSKDKRQVLNEFKVLKEIPVSEKITQQNNYIQS